MRRAQSDGNRAYDISKSVFLKQIFAILLQKFCIEIYFNDHLVNTAIRTWYIDGYTFVTILHNWYTGESVFKDHITHYSDVIMSAMASQIISFTIAYSTVYLGADQRKHIKALRHWPLWAEFTGDRWIPRTKGQLRGKCFHLMTSSWSARIQSSLRAMFGMCHDDVIKWKRFPRFWPFVRGIHRSPVNSPHQGQWRGTLMFSLICVWINGSVNSRKAGDLRRYRAHYDIIVMY